MIRLAKCANHGLENCPTCGTYAVIDFPDEKTAVAKLLAAAVDYTHGRITPTELVRIAKELPR